MQRKYKIFDYTWHIPHQYDMMNALNDECEFYHGLNFKRQWDYSIRPKPNNLHFVPHYESNKYDVAILHVDQQIIDETHLKRRIYEEFDAVITDIPKIVLNHGTPVFPERFFELNQLSLTEEQMKDECVRRVRDLVGHKPMVVNSYAAASTKEWGFGIPIIHGMNPDEWLNLPKEPRVFTAISPNGFDTYYNRGCLVETAKILHHLYGYILAFAKVNINTDNSFQDYKNYLGNSLLYLDTSFRTPMNRARTEAFLCGCCVIQVEGAHDLEIWAKDGENIILVPNDPEEIAKTVVTFLEKDYEKAVRIGESARKMASKHFSYERYKTTWLSLLEDIIQNHESVTT